MARKIKVALIFGGRSSEHEVSLRSARNVFTSLDKAKYEVLLVGIDRRGTWHLGDAARFLLPPGEIEETVDPTTEQVALVPREEEGALVNLSRQQDLGSVDVAFPILHGTYGEDGTIQGLFKLANIPFVGPSVLGSAVAMDKDVAKRLLRDAGIGIADFVMFRRHEQAAINYQETTKRLGNALFIKPANCGSSVGVSKATDEASFQKALIEAFKYDTKVLIESAIVGREIECSVLGNENPIASLPGEIISHHEFYSYEAKYLDQNGAGLEIPAKLPPAVITRIQETAIKAFKALNCEGMARVDFFVTEKEEILVNEINTIPGFTNISMYPKMWEASGIKYAELLDRLIQLAIERFDVERALSTGRE